MPDSPDSAVTRLLSRRTVKLAAVASASEQKRARLEATEAAHQTNLIKLQADALEDEARIQASAADQDRFLHETLTDFDRAIQRTVVTPAVGLPLLAGDLALRAAGDSELVRTVRENTTAAGLRELGQFLNEKDAEDSYTLQMDRAVRQGMDQEGTNFNDALRRRRIQQGTNKYLAEAEHFGREVVDAAGNYLARPTSLSTEIVGQIPLMGLGTVVRAATPEAAVAARAAAQQARNVAAAQAAGHSGRAAGSQLARQELIAKARDELVRRNTALAVTGTEVASTYADVGTEIQQTPIKELKRLYPEKFAEYAAKNFTDEQARDALASDLATTAAAINAPMALLSSRMGLGAQTNPLGRSAGNRIRETLVDVAGEAGEEFSQGVGSQMSGNLAKMGHGNEEVTALDGAGRAGGAGLAVSLGTSGVLQGPAVAGAAVGNAAIAAASAGRDVGKLALGALVERGKQVRANAEAAAKEQAQEVSARREQVAATVETELQDLGQGLPEDSTLDPQVRTELGAEGLGKVSTLSRVIEAIKVEEDPAKLNQYRIFGVKTARELSQAQSQITARLEAETDPEAKQRLESLSLAINELVANDSIQEMEEAMKEVPVEAVEQVFAKLPANIDTAGIRANPEVLQTLDLVREMTYAAPHKVSPAVAERARMLFQKTGDASPQDMQQLELTLELGTAEQEFQAANQAVYEKFPKVKTADEVRNNILETGFKTSKFRMPSLREYVNTIGAAMAGGNKERADAAMEKLLDFAVHIDRRARAFDATANAAIDKGTIDTPLDVTLPPTKDGDLSTYSMTLDQDGELKGNTYRLILGNEKSRAAIDNVFADSNLVARYYNALAKRYPELGYSPDANDKQAPTWESRIDLSQSRATNKPRSFAERTNPTAPKATETTKTTAPEQPAQAGVPVTESTTLGNDPDSPPWDVNDTRFVSQKEDPPASPETANSPPSDGAPFAVGKEAELEDRVNKRFRKKGRGYRAFGAKNMAVLAKLSKMIQERLGIGLDSGIVDQWGRLTAPSSTIGGTTSTFKDGTTVVAINVDQMNKPNKEVGDRTASDRRARTVAHELSHALDNKFWFKTGSFASAHPAFQPDGVVWNEMLAAMEKHPRLAKWFGYVIDTNQPSKELFAQIGALMVRTPTSAQEYFPNGTQLFREAVAALTGQTAEQLVPASVEQPAAEAAAEGSNRDGVSGVDASSAAPTTQPRRAGKSRFTEQQARDMSDETLDARINEIEDAREERGDTPNDLATLRVLVEELERREDQAAEIADEEDAAARAEVLAEAQAILAAGRGEVEEAAPDTRTLDDLAAMSEDEYIAAVNPTGKRLTDEEVRVLTAMDGIDLPEDAEAVSEITDKNGKTVAVYRDADGSRYAVEGDKVLAAVIEQNGSTLSHTLPAGRGRKLGQALMVEYLREFPFAQSGGFSEAGEKARRAAFQALSGKSPMQSRFRTLRDLPEGTPEELAARKAKDAALQAKYPNRTPIDFSPELEKLRRRNQWLHGFNLREDFAGALRNGLAGLQERVAGLLGQKGVGTDEHNALKTLSETVIPGMVKLLQARLTEKVKAKDVLAGTDPQLWQLNDKLSLHATNYGQGQPLAYDQAIAEGMASAGMLWMMETLNKEYPHDDDYVARFLKKLPEDLLPAEKAVFQEGQVQEAMVTELVRTLSSVLGITPNADASVTENDGLLQALAADTINILISEGNLIQTKHFLLQESVPKPDGSSTYISRLIPVADVAGHRARAEAGAKVTITQFMTLSHKREGGLVDLRKRLGPVGVRRLSSLLDPAREQSWQFGEPGEMAEKKIRGSDQDLSKEQREILRNQNAVAFKRNNAMVQWLMKLGREQGLALFGVDPDLDMEELNKVDRIRMRGIHKGWHRAWDAFEDWHAALLHEAELRGVSPDELPTHFRHYLTSNNRVMMDDSANPQSNKLLREIMMATISTMELGNEQHETALRLMVGQALEAAGVPGVPKIENARSHAEVVAAVDALMGEDGPLYEVWTALVQDDFDAGMLMDQMMKAGFKADGSAVKAFNALHAWAAYDMARSRGDKTVDIALAFEQDGKTDGPANAMAQLGLHSLSETLFLNLDRAGYFIGREQTALGDVAGLLGDLYGAVAEGANKMLHDALTQLREQFADQKLPPIARKTAEVRYRGLAASLRLFARVGWFGGLDRDGLGELTESKAKRSFGKVAVTPIGYGGGAGSVAGALSRDLREHLYAEMSESIQTGDPIPDVLADSINALITHQLYIEEVKGRRYLRAKEVAKPINFSDVSKYKEFELSPLHLRALNSHMVYGAANALRKSTGEQMESTLEGMGKLIAAANLQSAVLQYEFDKAYAARRAELIETKQILPEQALSRNQEKELLRDLVPKLAPIVQFKSTVAQGSEQVGLNMAETDRNAVISEAHKRGVESLFGGLSTNVSRMGFADPGVRAGALTIIAGGDATMMANFFSKVRPFLNVWDGLETPLVELFSAGREINQAVYDAWQHDLLGEVNKQFQSKVNELRDRIAADPALEDMLERKLMLKPTDKNPNPVFGYLDELAGTLDSMAKETRLVKRAMSELGISIDHMAGARQPFVKDGLTMPREELVTWLIDRVEQLRAQDADIAATTASEAVVGEGESPRSRGFNEILMAPRADLPEITKILEARLAKEGNKVQQFVWQHIKPLLPTDLVIHRGTVSELRDRMREVFPDLELPAGRIEGGYMQGHVFLANDSTETLLHELVHAAVTGLIDRYYAKGKGLTAHQRDAVVELEALTREFMHLDPAELNPLSGQAVDSAQRTIGSLLEQGDVGGAVNEYLAWTLTSRDISSALQRRKAPYGLGHLAQVVRKLVRKMLGLPNNPAVTTYLEATLGQFHRLTRVGRTLESNPSGRMLYQLLQQPGSTGQNSHEVHLRAVFDELQTVLGAVPAHQITAEHRTRMQAAIKLAEQQRDAFLAAGFPLSKQEQMVFELTQAMFASSLQLDPRVVTALQHLQEAAAKMLTVEDFMADPSSTDTAVRSAAQAQYDAVFGSAAMATDSAGRSTQLANFVALALVHEPMRAKLNQLTMPKPVAGEKTADGQLRAWSTRIFDRLADVSLGLSPNLSQRAAVDLLMTRLSQIQVKWARTARSTPSAFDRLEQQTQNRLAKIGAKAESVLQARQARGQSGGMNGYINLALNSIRAMTTEEGARDFGEDVLATTSHLPKELRELFTEMVGGTSVSRPVHELLNQARSKVAQVRQRLREEAPQHVRNLFSKQLSSETWGRLVRSVGKTDLQALLGSYSGNQILAMLADRVKLDTEIQRLESQLTARREWVRSADNLAHYMMTGTQLMANGPLYRNAAAIARQPGFGRRYAADTSKVSDLIDRLVTLKAMTYLSATESGELVDLFRTERAGVEGLVKLMRQRVVAERGKVRSEHQRFNQWKGYVPVSMDPRRDVVLAGPERGAELLKLGYVKLQNYAGDSTDPAYLGLAYYAINAAGGRATYNQGALQTVEGTVMGVDHLTGATLDPAVKTLIKNPKVVASITATKARLGQTTGTPYALLPVFDAQGEVVAYERPLSKEILDQHLAAKPDLAQSIGMWMGRQAEEEIAREFNSQVVTVLKKTWDDFKGTNREKEFVDITDPKAPATLRDTWNAIPRETQTLLLEEFGGAVMVRKDMLNNALGYRSASVGDAFLGMGDLPKDVREGIVNVASALVGKNAYRYLVAMERSWQGLIGAAKDVIVVRSGVVALANGISNQFQLVMHGVPVTRLLQIQAAKVAETETYLRSAHRIARIQVELDSTTDLGKRRNLERERQALHDQNRRLSIWPLVEAGELPTIAEGLTEQDQYTLLGDAMGWLEKRAQNLPQGVLTAAKYATISKDTALYQGMNRMIQFGDFMAKAALYDHLVQQRGLDQAEALRIISERFVNYNLLAGRSRDYLESMGLTWFMNYKLRIQKVVLSTLRENPLRFLMAGAGADWLGADSLLSSSFPMAHWEAAVGPGMLFRADNALMWNQLMK